MEATEVTICKEQLVLERLAAMPGRRVEGRHCEIRAQLGLTEKDISVAKLRRALGKLVFVMGKVQRSRPGRSADSGYWGADGKYAYRLLP